MLVGLGRLIQAGFVETISSGSFRNPVDVFHDIKSAATKTHAAERSTKSKIEQQDDILKNWKKYREQNKTIKQALDNRRWSAPKRRKLANGKAANGDFEEEDNVPRLDVRLNRSIIL